MNQRRRGINFRDVLIAIACVVVVALLGLVIYNQYNNLQDARAAVQAEKEAITRAEARLAHLQNLKANEVELRAQLAYLEGLVPEKPSEDDLMNYIQSAANYAGIRFVQVRFQPRIVQEKFVEMPLTITFEGRFRELLTLLEVLRIGDRIVNVEFVRVGQGQEGFPQIRVEMTGKAFSRAAQ
jgi:Tfp pilus assembly protein PilO